MDRHELLTHSSSPVEALSYATPVVSTPVGIAPELVEDDVNGYLFDEGDVEDLLACIRRIAANDRERMRQAALESVAALSWDETVAELTDYYASSSS